jgi:hypothetical protein
MSITILKCSPQFYLSIAVIIFAPCSAPTGEFRILYIDVIRPSLEILTLSAANDLFRS